MKRHQIAVTGMGLIGPGGIGVQENWRTVRDGRSTAGFDPELADQPVRISCRVPGFDPKALLGGRAAHRLDRCAQFAIVAAREAVRDAGLDPAAWDGARVGVVIGTAAGGSVTYEAQQRALLREGPRSVSPLTLPMFLPNMTAGQVAIDLHARGPGLAVSTACASAATAIQVAMSMLRLDQCDIAITGGTDALITPVVMAAFTNMGSLSARQDPATASRPFDADRDGFVAGEGAGILILERAADALARAATIRAHILGCGTSLDAHHITAPDPGGHGAERALRNALTEADAAPGDVDAVNAHGTSTPMNDLIEATVLGRVLKHGPPITSTKGSTGHLLGAAGALEAIVTIRSLQEQTIPPTANLEHLDPRIEADIVREPTAHRMRLALSNSFGFGGHNAVLALGHVEPAAVRRSPR